MYLTMKHFQSIQGKPTGDIIKGRTFRRLNVTRKIIVKDVPDLIRSALNMQTFALGQKCIRQCRGSPMGSPLCSLPHGCPRQRTNLVCQLQTHLVQSQPFRSPHPLRRQPSSLWGLTPHGPSTIYEVLLDDGFYGKPIILETVPDYRTKNFLASCLRQNHCMELIYRGPTNSSQVLSFFSISTQSITEWLLF